MNDELVGVRIGGSKLPASAWRLARGGGASGWRMPRRLREGVNQRHTNYLGKCDSQSTALARRVILTS